MRTARQIFSGVLVLVLAVPASGQGSIVRVSASLPNEAASATPIEFVGRVAGAPARSRVALENLVKGSEWRVIASAAIRNGRFSLRWRAMSAGRVTLRLAVRRNGHELARTKRSRLLVRSLVEYCPVRPLANAPPGDDSERWTVKTLTDPAAVQVMLAPQQTTIADLVRLAPPSAPTNRVPPTEMTTFAVSATVIFARREVDRDYHLVLSDGRNTMITESPDPACASGSVVLDQIEKVRASIDAALPGLNRGEQLKPNLRVGVTGVGFFDRVGGQTGVAPNGIELHPLLSFSP